MVMPHRLRNIAEKYSFLLSCLLFASVFALAYHLTLPAEDAVILYEYAKNLAGTGIITYGGAGTPIEGATDFLWMILISIGSFLGAPEFASALFLSLLGTLFLVNIRKDLGYRCFAILALFLTPFFYSALLGFSTLFFTSLYVYCLFLARKKKDTLYFFIFLLCLTRPDGVVWGTGVILLRWLEDRKTFSFKKECRLAFLTLILPGIIYFLWRFWYFSEWLPLPFLVKSSSPRDLILFYSASLRPILVVLVPIILSDLFLGGLARLKKTGYVMGLPILFYAAIWLEQNIGNRFMAPLFFGYLFLLSYEKKPKALLLFVLLSLLCSFRHTPVVLGEIEEAPLENIYPISKAIAGLHGKMLTTESGRFAYNSNWQVHDSWGLNTPAFAHRMIRAEDLEKNAYDLIVTHCSLELLNQDADLSRSDARNWDSHCKAMISYMKKKRYTTYLVPFKNAPSGFFQNLWWSINDSLGFATSKCPRYDIYAISPTYPDADKMQAILKKSGGFPDSPHIPKKWGYELCPKE